MENRTCRLILMPSGRQGNVSSGVSVLEAARSLGVEIESICGGRLTCGKCLVAPEWGTFAKHGITSSETHLSAPSDNESDYAKHHHIDLTQQRLSCVAQIIGDLLINVPEGSLARKQVVRKDASDLLIEVAPAVRLVYAEVQQAYPGCPGDWERLQAALAEQWNLHNLTIDLFVLRTLQPALRENNWGVTVTIWQNQQVIRIESGYVESLYGLAVDVGSTTVALHLCDLRTGSVLVTESAMNPQVRFGEDLLSRISYAMNEPQGLKRLHRAILKTLNDLTTHATAKAGIRSEEITDVVIVGNTVMHHILLSIDPVELGHLPFALAVYDAVDIKARDLGLNVVHNCAMVHLLPCIAGYVGADNVGVLLAEQSSLDEQITLVVDVGTNAEILLGNKHRMLSASSPTGPAFEGAHIRHGQRAADGAIERVRINPNGVRYKVIGEERWSDQLSVGESLHPTGICGSGIIEVVAELFTNGLIDRRGRFVSNASHPNLQYTGKSTQFVIAAGAETATGHDIVIVPDDIRAVQLAKGALYAGIKLLMVRLGITRIDRIKLAGAFGSYIDAKYAMRIGLIPDCDLNNVFTIGNAAGDGARIALLNTEQRRVAQKAARAVLYVEMAAEVTFQDEFADALSFPHASDAFPHAGL